MSERFRIPIRKLDVPALPAVQRRVAEGIRKAIGERGDNLRDIDLRAISHALPDLLETDAERVAATQLYRKLEVPLPPRLAVAPTAVLDRMFGPARRNADGTPVRTTRLVNTLGPASGSPKIIAEMIQAGTDVVRLNFSHLKTTEAAFALVRAVEEGQKLAGRKVKLLADLPGPKIRLGDFEGEKVLAVGEQVTFHGGETDLANGLIEVNPPSILDGIEEGHRIFLNDGKVQLRVVERTQGELRAEVVASGPISSRKGMNLPDTPLRGGLPSKEDRVALAIVSELEKRVDAGELEESSRLRLFALSYVETAEHVRAYQAELPAGSKTVAKIERPLAMKNLSELLAVAHGGMDARGDRKVEMGAAAIASGQETIHAVGALRSRPTGTATQVVSSMVSGGAPSNAELTDVFNTVRQGGEFIMTSEETAVGVDPALVVRTLHDLLIAAEAQVRAGSC